MDGTKLPPKQRVKAHIKGDLPLIEFRRYSVDKIYNCLRKYGERQAKYEKLIREFAVQVQTDAAVSKYVHSVRFRVKDPLHLADKLVRKCLDKRNPRNITARELFLLNVGVTDLGAVRILHLRRQEWEKIHQYLTQTMSQWEVVAKTAYVRRGDRKRYAEYFSPNEIVDSGKNGYTSIHYVIAEQERSLPDLYFECQVRTLFEEGWGEIDHQLNYPHKANKIVGDQLGILNTTSSTANDIAEALENLEYLPLFVPWETEQRLERSADTVYCLTPDLAWVTRYRKTAFRHFRQSKQTKFYYYALCDDPQAKKNFSAIQDALRKSRLSSKVRLALVPAGISGLPVISDILLLLNAVEPLTGRTRHFVVLGSSARRLVRPEEQLDMVIDDPVIVQRLRRFFETLPRG
jgi:ppGpp synthetase/RelA/SpoT-type nucleotidyltranferase